MIRRAQSLTELALLMPLLTLLLVGLLELGFLLYAHVEVSSAAREAARAASLYRATRYSSFADNEISKANPKKCAPTIAGWSLQQTIEQAILRRTLDSSGCPTTGGVIVFSALGLLDSTQATSTSPIPFACPSGNANGWSVGLTPAFTATGTVMPTPGAQATVTLCYPYRPILLSELLPFFDDPVWISKAVNFLYQP
jgi:Flp pilus assembly protein TadG